MKKKIQLKQTKPCEHDAQFLCRLMNDEHNLTTLREVPTGLSDWREALTAWDADADEEDFLIYGDAVPVGWLGVNGLAAGNHTAYIKMVVLLPEYQNKGIGTAALRQVVEHLEARGYSTFILYTDKCNRRAQACYQKCGFTTTETLVEKMSDGTMAERLEMTRREIRLKQIDQGNFLDCFHLELAEGQERFVSHPIRSLAQAYVYYHQCTPFGIYAGETMVGYVMVIYDYDTDEYNLWHLMIDKHHQGRGYGRRAVQKCLDYIAAKPFGSGNRVVLTCHEANTKALSLYESLGFHPTGNTDDEEIELALIL